MAASDYDLELVELHKNSVGKLLTELFDLEAFLHLKKYLCAKLELIKEEHVVSKQVLGCILDVVSVLESRSEWMPEVAANKNLISEFYMLLGLIALGDGCNDRKPGMPRVV